MNKPHDDDDDGDGDDDDEEGGGDISHGCHQLSAGIPLLRIAWETSGIIIKRMDLDDDHDHNGVGFITTNKIIIIIVMKQEVCFNLGLN